MGIFDPPNMQIVQIVVIGDPQMTFGGIWSQNIIMQIFAFFTPKIGILTSQIYANFGHGRPPNNFWGHLEQQIFLFEF